MNLNHTEKLIDEMFREKDFDSYAVLVSKDGQERSLMSDNVNEDTYFDIASMGKVLVTSTLILNAVGNGKLSLDDTLDKFFENVPKILETPYIPSQTLAKKSYAPYKYEIEMLRSGVFDPEMKERILADNESL